MSDVEVIEGPKLGGGLVGRVGGGQFHFTVPFLIIFALAEFSESHYVEHINCFLRGCSECKGFLHVIKK